MYISDCKNNEEMHNFDYNNFEEMYVRQYPEGKLEEKSMYFKRKVYNELLNWKEKYADRYAVLLEGARRVGKSTIAEQFAINEYKSYILIDFSKNICMSLLSFVNGDNFSMIDQVKRQIICNVSFHSGTAI